MEMPLLNLEDPDCLPEPLRAELRGCEPYFSRWGFLEQIRDEQRVYGVIERINDYCMQNLVVGYHYTRALREDLQSEGLRPRSGEEIRKTFLERFDTRFTPDQIVQIKEVWGRCYDDGMQRVRDGRIFFNFTREALGGSGSELLLGNYGGEQVYFYIAELPGIGEALSTIGEPFIVKCALVPSEVRTFIQNPWGQILASSYHRRVNPRAHQIDQDGYQLTSVPPNRIELLSAEH